MSRPLVSVIVPVYNVEAFLRPCVDSVFGQSFQDLEIILVNDGSTDASPQICDRCADADPRVRVIHQQNRGLSAARNRGLDEAAGRYVYFLDSDDYITGNAVRKLVERAEADQLDVVLFEGGDVDESGAESARSIRRGSYPAVSEGRALFTGLKRNDEFRSNVQLLFIRRAFLADCGLRFCDGILHEDEPFTFLLLMQAARCGCLPQVLLYKRKRSGSIMQTPQTGRNVEGCLRGLEQMVEYCLSMSFDGPAGDAVLGHLAYMFWNTYTRFRNLSASERKEHAALKKRLFDLMSQADYLQNPKVRRLCRFEWASVLSAAAADAARRIRRRLNAVEKQDGCFPRRAG